MSINTLLKYLTITAGLLLVACATPGGSSLSNGTPEEIVTKRAQERQDFLLIPNYESVYEYLSPGYRALKDYRAFLATQGSSVNRVSAKVLSATCEPDICIVNVEVGYYYTPKAHKPNPDELPYTRISEEKWIKVDGQWWLHKDTK